MARYCSTIPFIHANLSTNQTSQRCLLSTPLGNPLLTISDNIRCQEGSLALFFNSRPTSISVVLSFNSRPTSISFSLGRFLLPYGQRGFFFPGRFLLPRGQWGTSLPGAFFYLAANEDSFSRALSFTSRPTRIPSLRRFILPRSQRGSFFPGRFFLPRGQRVCRAFFFYLAVNEELFQDVFFYLAANEDPFLWPFFFLHSVFLMVIFLAIAGEEENIWFWERKCNY